MKFSAGILGNRSICLSMLSPAVKDVEIRFARGKGDWFCGFCVDRPTTICLA